MPARVIPVTGREGSYMLLEAALPEQPVHPIGVLLADARTDRLYFRLRSRFDDIANSEEREVLDRLADDVRARVEEMGAAAYLQWLGETASNAIRVTGPETVQVDSFARVLERLFDEYVEPVPVEPYRTHLPLYSGAAAAGAFSREQPVPGEPEAWVPAPGRLAPDLFVFRVEGRSMEPRIPSGSLNVFRARPAGSRQGKIVLVELLDEWDDAARFTVKRYTSTKEFGSGGEWHHSAIRLEPINPEFKPLDLEPGKLNIIGEWVCALE